MTNKLDLEQAKKTVTEVTGDVQKIVEEVKPVIPVLMRIWNLICDVFKKLFGKKTEETKK